ncbi:MAG: hypothetical protein ACLPVY_01580 [Acidimicrobiia bacterium]
MYDCPSAAPTAVTGDTNPDPNATGFPADTHVALNATNAEPFKLGGTKLTTICPSPDITVGAAATPGNPTTIELDPDATPEPTPFVDTTEQSYPAPFVNPDTTIGDTPPA